MRHCLVNLIIFLLSVFSTLRFVHSAPAARQRYQSIISFGDSYTDTGNLVLSNPLTGLVLGRLPYGETFGRSTGRVCNGRLVIDFIAEEFGLPPLKPYLARYKGEDDFRSGVNFAVSGATALDEKFLFERGIVQELTTVLSLSVQLDWFKELKPSLCSSSEDCDEYFQKSLFMMGEIGINDYNYALKKNGGNCKQTRELVPLVIQAVGAAITILIKEGAVEIAVPSMTPIGCLAADLTMYRSKNKQDYDPTNSCLKQFNQLARYHNQLLQVALDKLRKKHPEVKIFYLDYYGSAIRFYNSPQKFGFSNGATKACCGGGGPYNYDGNGLIMCGIPGSTLCKDPTTYANWDGIHLTEAANRIIANGFLKGPYSLPLFHT